MTIIMGQLLALYLMLILSVAIPTGSQQLTSLPMTIPWSNSIVVRVVNLIVAIEHIL